MDQFVATYISVCQEKGKTVNVAYNPSGSGDGRTQFIAGQIDFAGSDSAIKDEQADKAKERCVGGEAWNLPLVFGPIAVAYNLDGVDKLVLNAEVLAKIFNGGITKWNDPAIAALNSGASLPDEKITTVIRSDSSGTTDNFQKYLDAASNGAWTSGAGSDFTGGVGEGAKGSAGVAQAVATAPGSITYVEKSFADQNKLSVAEINTGSEAVALTNDTAAEVDRRREVQVRRNRRPDARPRVDLQDQRSRRIPAGSRHVLDRLLQGLRRGHLRSSEVVPDERGQRGSGQPGRAGLRPAAVQRPGSPQRVHHGNQLT